MSTLSELLEEAADWIAADRDELILCETINGDTSTMPEDVRALVDQSNDLIGRLMTAARTVAE